MHAFWLALTYDLSSATFFYVISWCITEQTYEHMESIC